MTIDSLLKQIREKHKGVHAQAYADDVSLIITGMDPDTLRNRMQHAMKDTAEWCRQHGLKVNPSKTESIMFTLNRKWNMKDLKLNGEKVERNHLSNTSE
jgi:hypothetical protein